MAGFPFVIPRKVTVAAASTNTGVFNISSGETFYIHRIQTDLNTAGLFILNVRDQRGRAYMLGDANNPIPLAQVGNTINANHLGALDFVEVLIVEPNGTLYVDIQNTTGGSLSPTIIAIGRKEIGSGQGA